MAYLDLQEVLEKYPPCDPGPVEERYRRVLEGFCRPIVVLDDDPTGIQTVHGVPVYTDWSRESIRAGLAEGCPLVFLLTNSRALSREETIRVHREIADHLLDCAPEGDFVLISRGDSTLRGHYPEETQALRERLEERTGRPFHGEVLLPFFPEGGRYTVDNVHYVADGDKLVPAGETEFAKDKTFFYKSSDLREWVEEKTGGDYPAGGVTAISLEELRRPDYDAIRRKLMEVDGFGKVIINALSYADVQVFTTAMLEVLANGRRFLFRSAAALPKVMGGIAGRPLLEREDFAPYANKHGGLVVVGSHVQKTTRQLERLREVPGLSFVEVNQHLAVDPAAWDAELGRVGKATERLVSSGKTAVVYTRRERFDLGAADPEEELALAARISRGITGIVSGLTTRPSFLMAKGGITSSDIGKEGLGVRRAVVLGQILPGVPVWLTGEESRFPNTPYVIFPGNVGDDNAMADAVKKLMNGKG